MMLIIYYSEIKNDPGRPGRFLVEQSRMSLELEVVYRSGDILSSDFVRVIHKRVCGKVTTYTHRGEYSYNIFFSESVLTNRERYAIMNGNT